MERPDNLEGNQVPQEYPGNDPQKMNESIDRFKKFVERKLAASKEAKAPHAQKKPPLRAPSTKPAPQPVVDGKMSAAGPDRDDDELVPDGKGGMIMKKYL